MKKSIFIFFVSLTFGAKLSFSQEMLGVEKGGLDIGFDMSRIGILMFEDDRKAWEFSLDLQLNQKLYLATEIGFQKVAGRNEANYLYDSRGYYATLGIDRLFFDLNKEGDNDVLYGGLRYGFSSMYQEAGFTIEDEVFGSLQNSMSERVSTHWLEAVFGVKVEMLKNLFLGISTRAQFGLILPKQDKVPHYLHAGYGNASNRLNVGFTYSVYYRIPMYKIKQPSK